MKHGDWRIYYADGAGPVCTLGVDEANMQKDGVVCIVQYWDSMRYVIFGGDVYFRFPNGEWERADRIGMVQRLMLPGRHALFFGVVLPTDQFGAIMKAAREDPHFPAAKREKG